MTIKKNAQYWIGPDFMSTLLEQLPSDVFWKSIESVFLVCNEVFAKALGLSSPQDIIGKTDYDLPTTKDESDAYRADDKEVMDSNVAKINIEEKQTLQDGKEVTLLTSKVPLLDPNGEVIGLLGIFTDITELKNTQKELLIAKEAAETANQAKSEFIQNMQHDIRTPAAGVWSLLSELAKQEIDPKKRSILEMLTQSSARLLDLCNAVVEFSYIDQHQQPIVDKKIDIREIAREVLDLNKPAAFGKDLTLHLKVSGDVPPHVMSDDFRLRRILVNLVGNAVKFTDEGSITIHLTSTRMDNRHILLRMDIEDTGMGIPEHQLNSIFEKFSRGTAADSNRYPGSGLGLYLVKKFVADLQGDLEVETRVGKSSCFSIILPVKVPLLDMNTAGIEIDETHVSPLTHHQQIDANIPFSVEAAHPLPYSHHILLIEDDTVCLFAATEVLAHFTNRLDIARNVTEAKQQLQQEQYDMIISDLGLPDGNGIDILNFIRQNANEKNHATPCIALTAYKDNEKHQQALDAGFNEVATKPLTVESARRFFEAYPASSPFVSKELPTSELPIIDLELGKKRLGTDQESKAMTAIEMLLDSLVVDMKNLQKAKAEDDNIEARQVLHKINGGLNYSGAPRLQYYVSELHHAVKKHEHLNDIAELFQKVEQEVQLLNKEYRALLKLQQKSKAM